MKTKVSKKFKNLVQSSKLSLTKMAQDVKDPAAIIGGLVIGKIASDMLDKVINKTATVNGLGAIASAKDLIKPVALIAAGLAAKQLMKNPIAKNIGIGVASYGGAVAVNSIINTPYLSSFGQGTPAAAPPAGTGTSGLGFIPRRALQAFEPARSAAPRGVIL